MNLNKSNRTGEKGRRKNSKTIKNEPLNPKRYVVETITMTTVTKLLTETTNATNSIIASTTGTGVNVTANAMASLANDRNHESSDSGIDTNSLSHSTYLSSANDVSSKSNSISAQITGILKGGKLWKSEQGQVRDSFFSHTAGHDFVLFLSISFLITFRSLLPSHCLQCEDSTSNVTSDDDSSKRSVRFIDASGNANKTEGELCVDRDICDGQAQQDRAADDDGV